MKSSSAFFVTATDTGVGKSVVAAGIAFALRQMGHDVGVVKPLATGCRSVRGRLVSDDAELLARAAGSTDDPALINPVAFRRPLAPYTAARLEGKRVDIARIKRAVATLRRRHDRLIVEGIGGIMVPIARQYLVRDLIADLRIPAVVVARPALGTLNHTLMTLACARERGIDVRALIVNFSRPPSRDPAERTNVADLRALSGGIPVVVVPHLGPRPEKRLGHPIFQAIARDLFST